MRKVFHEFRPAAYVEHLWNGLNETLPHKPRPTVEDVRSVVNGGRFDTYTMPEGFTITDLPHPLNALMDTFYMDVLLASMDE